MREFVDSREGFAADEYEAYMGEYNEYLDSLDDDGDYDPYYDEDNGDPSEWGEDDGQPDEYTEWQDYMGGDDWDHGQYDSEW